MPATTIPAYLTAAQAAHLKEAISKGTREGMADLIEGGADHAVVCQEAAMMLARAAARLGLDSMSAEEQMRTANQTIARLERQILELQIEISSSGRTSER